MILKKPKHCYSTLVWSSLILIRNWKLGRFTRIVLHTGKLTPYSNNIQIIDVGQVLFDMRILTIRTMEIDVTLR